MPAAPAQPPVLTVDDLKGGYGGRLIVDGVSLTVGDREIVTIIGHNGAGKSTVLKAIFNMLPTKAGSVALKGTVISDLPAHRMLTAGLAYVPQVHSLFPKLTIDENLQMGGYLLSDKALLRERLDEIETLFPFIAERGSQLAGTLSGGEQRILEVARTLLMDPSLIMLDEPSIGLAPKIVESVFSTVHMLRDKGKAFLMVEQNVRRALEASDRGLVLELGQIRIEDSAQALIGNEDVTRLYMGRGGKR